MTSASALNANTSDESGIFHVLITDRFDIEALAMLRGDARLKVSIASSPVPSDDELATAEGLIIRSRTKIDPAFLERAPRLKVIVTATSGFEHIDLAAITTRGLTAMYTPEANANSAAELTWALVLACARRVPDAHRAVKNGDWRREALLGRELAGRVYGVIGFGRIGSRVARIAQAFGMKVLAFDPYVEDETLAAANVVRVSLEELLKSADVLSFHVPATAETRHMIHHANLEYINRGAILVNTSRGSVIAESDLIEAIEHGWVGACGLDVFEREPLPRHSALMNLPNVVLSPHLGATTSEAFSAASREAARKILAFAACATSSDRLPPEEPWYRMGFSHPGPAPLGTP